MKRMAMAVLIALLRRVAPAECADARRKLADDESQIANLRRGIDAAHKARDFWRSEYERVVACWIGPDPDEARRAAIHRLARKVEAKRRAA